MTLSRYNYLFEKEDKYFLYNSLTNSFALVDNELYRVLSEPNKSATSIKELDDDTLNLLQKMKAIDVDDDIEINKLRYHMLSQRFNPYNLSLTINPTLSCNFACPYCFEASHEAVFMDDKTENGIIDYIKKTKARNLFVTWFGGEPLLAFDRIRSLSRKIFELDINYHSGMITNGYLLSEDIVNDLERLKIRSLQITLDGRPEKHDSRRCLKGGQPTFTRIIDNIILAQKLSPNTRISVRVNIDKNNDEDFVWLYNHIKDLNLPNVFVYPGFVIDISGKDCNSCLYNTNDITRFLINLYDKYGILIPFFYPEGRIASCSVRNANSTVIGPKGELYKCWNDVGDSSKVYGTIFGKPTNESILYKYLVGADHLADPVCQECKFLPICNGGCPYIRLQEEEQGKITDKRCLLFKNNIDDFLWIHYKSKKQKLSLNH